MTAPGELLLAGKITLEVDEAALQEEIQAAGRQSERSESRSPGPRGGGPRASDRLGPGEGPGIASALKGALGGLSLPTVSSPSQAALGVARPGGLPPGLLFAAGRVSARPLPPVPPPSLPSAGAGAARAGAAAGLGARLGAAATVAGPAILATAGVAAVGLGAKAAVDKLAKGVDARIERQLGAGYQFSPQLSQLALDREIRQRERAIVRGRLLGGSARDLQEARDDLSDITSAGRSIIDDQVNRLMIELIELIKPTYGNLVEAVARIARGLGGMSEEDFKDVLRSLEESGVDVGPVNEPLLSPELRFDNINLQGFTL